MLVGVVSDTHGYFDPQLGNAFAGADYILHAGDVGKPEVLERLREIAPLHAVRGNNDVALPLSLLPERLAVVPMGWSFC
jgi:putative phosphoesterase